MAQYYTDKQTIINLILTEQPELKRYDLRISLYMYFLFCLYIKLTSPVKEQIGIVEQDNFYPKYLFNQIGITIPMDQEMNHLILTQKIRHMNGIKHHLI